MTVPVADAQVDEQLQKFADQSKSWDDAGDKAAEQGDLVTVDFVGKTADGACDVWRVLRDRRREGDEESG